MLLYVTVGDENKLDLAWVPGAFEIPLVAKKMVESGKYDAVVCLGAVIRGATPHFDMVANEATKGVAHVGLQTGVPVIFGILTTDSIEQAVERAGTKAGNKGFDAMTTAIEMINLLKQNLICFIVENYKVILNRKNLRPALFLSPPVLFRSSVRGLLPEHILHSSLYCLYR